MPYINRPTATQWAVWNAAAAESQNAPSLTREALDEAINGLSAQASVSLREGYMERLQLYNTPGNPRVVSAQTGRITSNRPNITAGGVSSSEYRKSGMVVCTGCELMHHIKHRKVLDDSDNTICPKCMGKLVFNFYRLAPRFEVSDFVTKTERDQT